MTHFSHNGVLYIKVDIIDSMTVIADNQLRDLKTKLLSEVECLQNALTTAKMVNSQCVEGFVYCMKKTFFFHNMSILRNENITNFDTLG